jgi:hypothetical protein
MNMIHPISITLLECCWSAAGVLDNAEVSASDFSGGGCTRQRQCFDPGPVSFSILMQRGKCHQSGDFKIRREQKHKIRPTSDAINMDDFDD